MNMQAKQIYNEGFAEMLKWSTLEQPTIARRSDTKADEKITDIKQNPFIAREFKEDRS